MNRFMIKINNLTREEFYQEIKIPNDKKMFLPLCARVWIDGLEYEIDNINYFLPTGSQDVYRLMTLREIRNLKLKNIKNGKRSLFLQGM